VLPWCALAFFANHAERPKPLAISAPQPMSQVNRILPNADLATRAPLVGHVPRWATPANLVAGSVDPAAQLRLSILLRRSFAAQPLRSYSSISKPLVRRITASREPPENR
jgi:hypothetical protein